MIDHRLKTLLNEASRGPRAGTVNPIGLCHHCKHREFTMDCPLCDIRTTKWAVYECRDFRADPNSPRFGPGGIA